MSLYRSVAAAKALKENRREMERERESKTQKTTFFSVTKFIWGPYELNIVQEAASLC